MELSIIDLFLNASLVVVKAVILILIAASISPDDNFERWLYLNRSKEEHIIFEENFWSDLELESLLEKVSRKDIKQLELNVFFRLGI